MSERINAEETRAPERKGHRFEPGNPHRFGAGNPGRPKGSRNKLGEAFIEAMHDDFMEHGTAAIEAVRTEKPDQYLKVIASILPQEIKVTTAQELTDEQLDQRIRQLATFLEIGIAGASGGEEAPSRPH